MMCTWTLVVALVMVPACQASTPAASAARDGEPITFGGSSKDALPAFSPSGTTLAVAGGDGTIRLWDVESSASRNSLEAHKGAVLALTFINEKHLASSGADKRVRIWDLETGKLVRELEGHAQEVRALALSRSGTWLATGGADETVRLWDTATWNHTVTLKCGRKGKLPEAAWSVAFSSDESMLAVGYGDPNGGMGAVGIWNVATGKLLHLLDTQQHAQAWAAEFTPDDQKLVVGTNDGLVVTYTVSGWKVEKRMPCGDQLRGLAVSPEGSLAAAAVRREVRLWDLQTGEVYRRLTGHESDVIRVAFSPRAKLLASGSRDGAVRLWRLDDDIRQTTMKESPSP